MKAVYAGTFDPITYGHLDVIKRGSKIFDKVIVAVAEEPPKKTLFTTKERVEMIKDNINNLTNVEVKSFDTLLVDFLKKENANIILRGLRETSDFSTEFQQAIVNNLLDNSIESVFVMTNSEYFYITSSVVKEIARYGGPLSRFVPKNVEKKLKEKFRKT